MAVKENDIYNILIGAVDDPNIENQFHENSECSRLYKAIYDAKINLNKRLNNEGREDSEIELIINNMFDICRIIGNKMYSYGKEMREQGC